MSTAIELLPVRSKVTVVVANESITVNQLPIFSGSTSERRWNVFYRLQVPSFLFANNPSVLRTSQVVSLYLVHVLSCHAWKSTCCRVAHYLEVDL